MDHKWKKMLFATQWCSYNIHQQVLIASCRPNLVLLILPLFWGSKVSHFLFSWKKGQSHFLTPIINSFLKKGPIKGALMQL